jgi:cytidylate kinase
VACSVICISRAHGARGDEVGARVAERLGFRYVDEEIVADAAATGGISPADVADEERRKSALSRLFQEIGRSVATDSYGISGMSRAESATSDEIKGLIQAAIEETAARGKAVIVAHAASFALPHSSDALRVLVTASSEDRAQQLSDSLGFDAETAQKAIKDSDSARADYLRRFYRVESEQPTHYDLVVNTGSLGVEQAAELVVFAAGEPSSA